MLKLRVHKKLQTVLEASAMELARIDVSKKIFLDFYITLQKEIFDTSEISAEDFKKIVSEDVRDMYNKILKAKDVINKVNFEFDKDFQFQSVEIHNVEELKSTCETLDFIAEELGSVVVPEIDVEISDAEIKQDVERLGQLVTLNNQIEDLVVSLFELTAELQVMLELE